jgi:hypothetical protein
VPELAPLFPVNRGHLDALSTDIGIMQHAQLAQPDPEHGYCTDDVARALQVDLLHQRALGWEAVAASVARNVRFLAEAHDPTSGRFRNLRHDDGTWLDAPGSEDADARALQALAETVGSTPPGPVREEALALFVHALPGVGQVRHLRPLATLVLACDAAIGAGLSGEVVAVARRAGRDLWQRFEPSAAAADHGEAWPWPEDVVTYENELPARALIVGGRRLGHPHMVSTGLRVLDWLIGVQTAPEGHLRTIGNDGWWPRGRPRPRFDQQAISTTSLLLAADAAFQATGQVHYRDAMEMAYGWFLGKNDAHAPLADPSSGACGDGIGPAGVSRNQGAESTLMWLMALEHVRATRRRAARPAPVPRTTRVPHSRPAGREALAAAS